MSAKNPGRVDRNAVVERRIAEDRHRAAWPPAAGSAGPLRSRATSTMPAASASSPTSRAASRTRSSRTGWRSCATSSIAARSAPTRGPATAPACWCRSRTSSSPSKAAELGIALPRARPLRGRLPVHAARSRMARRSSATSSRETVAAGRPDAARLARRAGRQFRRSARSVKPTEPVHRQVFIGRGPTIAREDEFERRLYILRKVISNTHLRRARARDCGYYPVSLSCRTIVYKGMFLADQLGDYYPGPARSAISRSALALVHQRFSTNTFPTWPLAHPYRMVAPQRRDQHAARQRQLDGGAAGLGRFRAVRQRHLEALADLLRGPVGHRLLRQRARIPGAGRLLAAPCHDDADPGGLGRQPADGRGAARLLRISRRADGAVGRPGRGRLHRRPPDRRDARPQRPAPGALSRHRRRPRHHGVGGRRAADPGGEDRRRSGGCSRARCC